MRSIRLFGSCVAMAGLLTPVGAFATTTSCNIPAACAIFANNNGIALEGESGGADGVLGEASSGTIYGAGVEGESLKQTGADAAGTFGMTLLSNGVAPNYGVVSYGSLYGVYGQAGNTGLSSTGPGYGIFGQDNAGSKKADYNVGVTGLSVNNAGVLAEGDSAPSEGFYGVDGIPLGIYAVANNSNGNSGNLAAAIIAESNSYAENLYNTTQKSSMFLLEPGDLIQAGSTGSTAGSFTITNAGNMTLSGELTTGHGGPYLRTTGASGRAVTAYSEHSTVPSMEDFGEAQLVNGRAVVKLDAALADVIDLRSGYHVVITPEGENNGLYVVKGADGFLVREVHGGRSTLPFEYRIVAKPREENGARLARVIDAAPRVNAFTGATASKKQLIPLPLSPEDRLKRSIGPRAYAKLMTSLANRLAVRPAR